MPPCGGVRWSLKIGHFAKLAANDDEEEQRGWQTKDLRRRVQGEGGAWGDPWRADGRRTGGYGYALHLMVPYMRLADVYLMYAEAALMGYGSPTGKSSNFSKTALEAVNTIRARAGVDPVNSKFAGSVEDFLSELRRERAVELAFEKHRFNDLRRWLLLTEYPYTLKTSHEFERPTSFDYENPRENRVLNLREEVILERNFTEKHYWLPLKVSDVSICPEFQQNPGW